MIGKSAADDQAVADHAGGVFGKDALSGGIYASAKHAPLPAVSMTADGQFDGGALNIGLEIFGMMAKEDAESICIGKSCECVGVGLILLFVNAGGQTANGKAVKADAVVVKIGDAAIANSADALLVERDGRGMTPGVALVVAGKLMVSKRIKGGGN